MKVTPYLNYGGNCKEAFQFYEKNLGAKILFMMTHGEAPPGGPPTPPEWKDAILYAHLSIGTSEIKGSDVPATASSPCAASTSPLNADTSEEAGARPAPCSPMGAKSSCPCRRPSLLTASSMLRDKFGTSWMILHQRTASIPMSQQECVS